MTIREVYTGNGNTILADTSGSTGKLLDLHKLKPILEQNPEKEIYVGMKEDWFFTATKVSLEDLTDRNNLLTYSDWATPTVEIADAQIPCYQEIDKTLFSLASKNGYNRGINKFETWLPEFKKRIDKLGYPNVKEFFDKVDLLLKEHELKIEKAPSDEKN